MTPLRCTVAPSVQALHSKGIIHRDMKPENILYRVRRRRCAASATLRHAPPLTVAPTVRHGVTQTAHDDSEVVITDFGLAHRIGMADLQALRQVGSPSYVAPEVLQKVPNYTAACDVWSLGVIVYVMLSGIPPFFGKTDDQVRVWAGGERAVTYHCIACCGRRLTARHVAFVPCVQCTDVPSHQSGALPFLRRVLGHCVG